jgi:hypothetical protein
VADNGITGAALLMGSQMSAVDVPSPDRFREMLGLPTDPESVLRDVLSRDEFRESPVQSLVDRINEFILSGIQRILSWIADHWPQFGLFRGDYELLWTVLGSLFYGLILGLMVAAVLLLFHRVILPRLRRQRARVTETAPESEDRALSMVPSRDDALNLARHGKYRDGLIQLFRFVLMALHERGLLKLHPSRTNREILGEVSDTQPIKGPLTEMTVHFNAVRYGGMPCGKADFDHFLGLAEEITRGN